MDEVSQSGRWFRLGILLVVVAVLAAAAFLLRPPASDADARPLFVDDKMSEWRSAGAATKQATAELVIERLKRDGNLGPRTIAALGDSAERPALVDDLIAALDAASNRNTPHYVSPDEPISRTAQTMAAKLGWDK
jgi:hypothetical protein